jgi:outer membrane protein assembly factor BamB
MSAPAWLTALGLLNGTGSWGAYELQPVDHSGEMSRPPVLQWSHPLPGSVVETATHTETASPILHGPYIYVGAAGVDGLLVLDRRDGHLVRRLKANGPVRSAAVIGGDRVFFADASGGIWCYPLDGEKPIWSVQSGNPILSTPTVVGSRVYVSQVGPTVMALEASNGESPWFHLQKVDPHRSAELRIYGSPSPVFMPAVSLPGRAVGEAPAYVEALITGYADGKVEALQLKDGEPIWGRNVGEGQYPDIIAEPLVMGSHVILSAYTEPLLSYDVLQRSVRWRLPVGGLAAPIAGGGVGDRPDGTFTAEGRFIYHPGSDGKLRCVDGTTGTVVWEWDSGNSTALTRPVGTPAGVFVGSSGGGLSLIDPVHGKRVWAWNPGHVLNGVSAAPAVQGREMVLVTDAGNIASFVMPEPEPAPRPVNWGLRP